MNFLNISYILIIISIEVIYIASQSIFNTETWISIPDEIQNFKEYSAPPVSDTWKSNDTEIFVAIASFRDKRCALTLKNLFTKAKYPARLIIGD